MARKYILRSKEEKLSIVKQVLAGRHLRAWEPDINHRQVLDWVKNYQEQGAAGLEPKRKPGNPLARYERRKELLQYQIELLKRELLKKEVEVNHLKKINARKVGDAKRK